MRLQHDVFADACSSLAHAGKYSVPWSKTFYIPSFRKNCPLPERDLFLFPDAGNSWSLQRAPPLRYFLLGNFDTPPENSCGTENLAFEDV
jgi:hypothetical protein